MLEAFDYLDDIGVDLIPQNLRRIYYLRIRSIYFLYQYPCTFNFCKTEYKHHQ